MNIMTFDLYNGWEVLKDSVIPYIHLYVCSIQIVSAATFTKPLKGKKEGKKKGKTKGRRKGGENKGEKVDGDG